MYKRVELLPNLSKEERTGGFGKRQTAFFRLKKEKVLLVRQDDGGRLLFDASGNVAHNISVKLHDEMLRHDGRITLAELRSVTGGHGLAPAAWEELETSGLFLSEAPEKQAADKRSIPSLLLDLSAGCNLACPYCYSDARAKRKLLPRSYYEIALHEMLKELKSRPEYFLTTMTGGKQTVRLGLIGGGEPTLDPGAFTEAVHLFQNLVEDAGMEPVFFVVSNGTFNETVLKILIEKKATAQISLDGLPHIQNRQRPFHGGAPSYDVVIHNIRRLVGAGCEVLIRSTVTADSLIHMEELVDLAKKESIAHIHMEPVELAGRALHSGAMPPPPDAFGRELARVFVLGLKNGITVKSNHLPIILPALRTFCGACGKNRIVTTDGHISCCVEVTHLQHPLADTFVIGEIDTRKKALVMWEERIRALGARTLERLSSCQDCFLRYNCLGNCPAEALRINGDIYQPDRAWCAISRNTALAVIDRLLER